MSSRLSDLEEKLIEVPSYPWTFPKSSDAERKRRWKNIRNLMQKGGFDCLLIPGSDGHQLHDGQNVLYVANYVTYFGLSYVVFPLEGEPYLSLGYPEGGNPQQRLLLARYHTWIKNVSASQNQAQKVGEYIKKLKLEKGTMGLVHPPHLSMPFYEKLHSIIPAAKYKNATEIITGLRAVLSDEEIGMMKKAASLCDRSYEATLRVARPGVREYKVWGEILNAIVGNGSFHPVFCLVTSARRPIFPRSPPSHRKLMKGDTILVEVNGAWGGYSTQISYAVSLGRPEKELNPMFDICLKLYEQACTGFNEGKTYQEVKDDLDKRIRKTEYIPMTPQVHLDLAQASEKAVPGHNFEIHPCVASKDYTIGMKFGDHVIINKAGRVQSLMKTPHEYRMIKV